MNTKLHAVADGRPIRFRVTAGQISACTGAPALLGCLPKADWLPADRGHDAELFRDAWKDKGLKPCCPGRKSRSKPIKHDRRRYKPRNRIEIMFGRLKDWPIVGTSVPRTVFSSSSQVATRHERCAKVFLSAVPLSATVILWI